MYLNKTNMKPVKLSNDERLITLTKEAYDQMNNELIQLRDEKTVKIIATLKDRYRRDYTDVIYYVNISVPENIKPLIWELEGIVAQIKIELDVKSKNLLVEIERLEKVKKEAEEFLRKIKYVPNWIIKLFNK